MDFFKVIIISILCLLIYSCDTVPRKEYEELEARHQLLQEASKATDIKVVQQYKDINTIFSKVESVSGNLILARKNIEGINYSQVEKINIHIESISKELKNLRGSANKKTNPELFKTIEHLQNVIINKQKEIDLLKEDIFKKNVKIHDQGITIEQQQQEIDDKQRKIEEQRIKIEKQQAQQWHEMGVLLYNISSSYEEGSKGFLGINKGNFNKMKENKKKLLQEAKTCLENALNMGITASRAHLNDVNRELSEL